MNLSKIIDLFRDLEDEIDSLSAQVQSLKRDEAFLQQAKSTWLEDISTARSETLDDKTDTS
jgi:prefoldin subunit 5